MVRTAGYAHQQSLGSELTARNVLPWQQAGARLPDLLISEVLAHGFWIQVHVQKGYLRLLEADCFIAPLQRLSLRERMDMLTQPVPGTSAPPPPQAPAAGSPSASAASAPVAAPAAASAGATAAPAVPLPTVLSQPRASAGAGGSKASGWRARSSASAGSAPAGAAAAGRAALGTAQASQDLDAYSSEFAWMRALPSQPPAAPAAAEAQPAAAPRSKSAGGGLASHTSVCLIASWYQFPAG